MKNDMSKSAMFIDDGHKQEILPLDFDAEEKARNSNSAIKLETSAPLATNKTNVIESPAASNQMRQVNKPLFQKKIEVVESPPPPHTPMQQVNKPLFQNFESDLDNNNAPAMPAFRSAIYPAGYTKQAERTATESPIKPMAISLAPPTPAARQADTSSNMPESIDHSPPVKATNIIEGKQSPHEPRQKNIDIDILFGKLLYEARNRLNLSITQVAQETKIQKEYIEALESEDFNRLPPMVYVCAYVRKLSAIYKIEQSKTEQVIEALKKNLEVSLSEEIIAHLDIDREHSPEGEHKVRNLYWMAAAAFLLFIGLISIAVLMLMAPSSEGKKAAAAIGQPNSPAAAVPAPVVSQAPAAFDPARLEGLKYRQTIHMSELSPRH